MTTAKNVCTIACSTNDIVISRLRSSFTIEAENRPCRNGAMTGQDNDTLPGRLRTASTGKRFG
ncbi:hypothetical protein PISMIDRAFT_679785 [Pisolithus microcarpus 441]|uniref:Uncharacterized protein n=1 Tax=Pisolithus microcarpus 441 TaxID=765257 RepID=A0A0C9ZAB5_9AGAM|nr:hypothetical protein PISMIDRAFT_679785 [Pisolithus microcarpus 441]